MIQFDPQHPYQVMIGDKVITYKAPIKEVWMYDNVVILRLLSCEELGEKYPREFWARNIFGFDQNGNQLWQIEGNRGVNDELSIYTSVFVEDGELQAYNWNSILYTVDPKTGKTTYKAYVK